MNVRCSLVPAGDGRVSLGAGTLPSHNRVGEPGLVVASSADSAGFGTTRANRMTSLDGGSPDREGATRQLSSSGRRLALSQPPGCWAPWRKLRKNIAFF